MSDAKPKRLTARTESAMSEIAVTAPVPIVAPEPIDAVVAAVVAESLASPVAPPVSEMAAPVPPAAMPAAPATADDAREGFGLAQAALAKAAEETAAEISSMVQSGLAATTAAAIALLGARTLSEAVEINATLFRRRANALMEGSARLSEIGVRTMSAVSQPLFGGFAAAWNAIP